MRRRRHDGTADYPGTTHVDDIDDNVNNLNFDLNIDDVDNHVDHVNNDFNNNVGSGVSQLRQ